MIDADHGTTKKGGIFLASNMFGDAAAAACGLASELDDHPAFRDSMHLDRSHHRDAALLTQPITRGFSVHANGNLYVLSNDNNDDLSLWHAALGWFVRDRFVGTYFPSGQILRPTVRQIARETSLGHRVNWAETLARVSQEADRKSIVASSMRPRVLDSVDQGQDLETRGNRGIFLVTAPRTRTYGKHATPLGKRPVDDNQSRMSFALPIRSRA
jgi:hypothetical protein